MGGSSLIVFLIIGAVAGWLAGNLMKGSSFGILRNMGIGIVGSFIGGWAFGIVGLQSSNMIGSIITATAGAIILLYILRLVKKA